MAESNDPKKDTVRIIALPAPNSPESRTTESEDTVRINLPSRPPANPSSAPPDLPSPAARATATMPASTTPPTPEKETARMTVVPNTQPKPAMETPATTVTLAATPEPTPESKPQPRVDQISRPLCWTLLGVSATILILQIWNYLS